MILQTERLPTMKKLVRRREELRYKLRDHFCLPVSQRNYKDFASVVDELDEVRKKIQKLKGQQK